MKQIWVCSNCRRTRRETQTGVVADKAHDVVNQGNNSLVKLGVRLMRVVNLLKQNLLLLECSSR